MADQLVDFLRNRKEHAPATEIDWQSKRDSWVRAVEGLYDLVREMLRPSIAVEDVIVHTFDVQVTEDFIGTYSIPVLELSVGSERVELRPKGLTVIGAEGRVDLRGAGDTVTLLKVPAKGEWEIVLQRVPHLKMVNLDRESLKDALERVMLPLT